MMSSPEGKTILLTGATGFIGHHLRKRLSQMPFGRLVLLSRTPSHEDKTPEWGNNETRVVSSLDTLSPHTWKDHGIDRIDTVFHLGGFIPKKSGSGDDPSHVNQVYRDNLEGTRGLLDSLPFPPQRIVFASTIDVYAPLPEGAILTESSAIRPSGIYGASKLFCESLIESYARRTGCAWSILRYGHLYGPGEGSFSKLIPQAIKALLEGRNPVLYGDGSVLRDFLYVGDAVEASVRALSDKTNHIGPLNIVRGESRPIREFVELLARITGYSGGITSMPDRDGGQSLRFDNTGMLKALGKWSFFPMEEGLHHEIEYFRERHRS